jgi:hypothetical protein
MRDWLLLLSFVLPAAVSAQEGDVPPGQVSLDDVWCAVCHFEQGDEFALSVHYQRGLLLCNDCHGGDPFEPRPERAKAPATGFIGKPSREAVAGICARCHSGPAEFFAMGPHASTADPNNPTCITCHQNHRIVDATLAVMDTTCAACHGDNPGARTRAETIQAALRAAAQDLHLVGTRFDSLQQLDAGLRRSAGLLASAAGVLRQIEPRTHALDVSLIDASTAALRDELEAVQGILDAAERWRQQRWWIVAGVWSFVIGNVVLLWWRRRQL